MGYQKLTCRARLRMFADNLAIRVRKESNKRRDKLIHGQSGEKYDTLSYSFSKLRWLSFIKSSAPSRIRVPRSISMPVRVSVPRHLASQCTSLQK